MEQGGVGSPPLSCRFVTGGSTEASSPLISHQNQVNTLQKRMDIYHQEHSSVTRIHPQSNVSVAIDVISVDDLDAEAKLFRVKILAKLTWFDSR